MNALMGDGQWVNESGSRIFRGALSINILIVK
jgi:hypothetical protein